MGTRVRKTILAKECNLKQKDGRLMNLNVKVNIELEEKQYISITQKICSLFISYNAN